MTHFPLALAACSALVVSSAQCQGLHTYIIEEGVTLPSGDQLRGIDRFLPNAGGAGWAALLTVDPGARREIWADFVDDGASVPQRLFSLPLGANDFVQNLRLQDVRNGSVIWEMYQGAGGMILETGVWIDGVWEPRASGAGPIAGSTWIGTPRLQRTTSGSLVAFGELEIPSSPPARLVMELGASAPLLMERDTITGTNVQLFLSYAAGIPNSLDISPNGERVIAVVSGSDQRR